MAFFSQKEHKVKRSHSTEHTRPHPTTSIISRPSISTRTRASSRPKTIYDPHPIGAHVRGPDHKSPTTTTPKLNVTPSTPRHSLRRVPVPSLSTQDVDGLPYDRTSPIIPSSRSTSISGKSSIADLGAAYNGPSYNSESSSGISQNPGGPCDPEKTVSPISDLTLLVSSPKQLAPSPKLPSQKPQRAVLRRKSNAKQLKPQPSNQSLTQKKPSKPDLGISSVTATPKRAFSSAHRPLHSVSASPLLDAAHRVRRSTSDEPERRSPQTVSPLPSPRVLTPAGALVAAYKEQEMRRSHSNDFARPDHLSRRDSCDESGGVYYTVFGSSGEVPIAAPEDGSRSPNDTSKRVSIKAKDVSRKPSLGPLSRLSRKSSSKVKKNGTNGFMSESECGHERVTRDEEVRRSSLQGRRSTSVPAKHRRKKSLGIAIDNSDAGLIWDSPQSASTPSKSAGWPGDEPSPSAGGKIWKLVKRLSTGGLKDKYQAQDSTPPVPALPEGLLSTPPPRSRPKTQSVPQSPNSSKLPYIRGRSSFGDAALMNRNTSIRGFPPSRPPALGSGKNPSHRRQSTNTRSSSPVSSDMASFKYWQKSRSSSISTFDDVPPLPERIVSERILSPSELIKLEKEQTAVEHSSPPSTVDSHSPAASASNHRGNAAVVTRKSSLLAYLQASGEESETDGMSGSEFVALPTPPRHHYKPNPHIVYNQSNGSNPTVGSVSTSPTIPMFSTLDVVNQFHQAKLGGVGVSRSLGSSTSQSPAMSSDEMGLVTSVQPPPRPRRSDKRKTLVANHHIAMRASLDQNRRDGDHGRKVPSSTSSSLPRERTFGLSSGLEDGEGRSYGTFGSSNSKGLVEFVETSRDSSSSREDLTFSPSIHSRSPLRFREMRSGEEGGKDKKALTEKEKADRWHDLLERSDRAGGTIHIGNSKLPSDSLRFSDYSTLTTLAL